MRSLHGCGRGAFTLIELLVVIAIVAILIGVLLPALSASRRTAMSVTCGARFRSVGQALHIYADDSDDLLPTADHAPGFGDPDPLGSRLSSWSLSLLGYLGAEGFTRADLADSSRLASRAGDWRESIEALYRCPHDPRGSDPPATLAGQYDGSMGFNVYFVLTPGELDPTGSAGGRTWRRRCSTPRPSLTVAFGEVSEGEDGQAMVDHFMAHFWTQFGAPTDRVAKSRHGAAGRGGTASYLMLDGHAVDTRFEDTFVPAADGGEGRDNWNPATARKPIALHINTTAREARRGV